MSQTSFYATGFVLRGLEEDADDAADTASAMTRLTRTSGFAWTEQKNLIPSLDKPKNKQDELVTDIFAIQKQN